MVRIDMTGRRFGRWTVIGFDRAQGEARWLCKCDCGGEKSVPGSALRRGASTSCGCFMRESVAARQTTHGHKSRGYTPEYIAWQNMIARCENPNHAAFDNYGGRGIHVCVAWRESFEAFFAHVGTKPSCAHSIDRIDNDRGYEPGNVRWATKSEQAKNRRARPRTTLGQFAGAAS